jgi:DNA-binding transcriptional regulator YiaG
MPNFTSALKEEIVRLARKELRQETERLKKASAAYRSEIAALKRRVTALEKQMAQTSKKNPTKEAAPEEATKARFSAKGLVTHRQRLGLSAADLGTLLGVSAQSIYLWEAGKTKPRQQQILAIAALRKMGKREAKARLANPQE